MKIRLMKLFGAAALGLALTGCSLSDITGSAPDPRITGAYEVECTVTAYIIPPGESADGETQFCFGGSIKRLGPQFWEMSISSPDTVAGMEIVKTDSAMTSRLDGLSFDIFTEEIPSASPVAAVFGALDSAAVQLESGGGLSSGENGSWVMNGSGYSIIFDSTGAPVSMSLTASRITAEFTSFSVIGPDSGALSETSASFSETALPPAETSLTSAETSAPLSETSVSQTAATEAESSEALSEAPAETSVSAVSEISEPTSTETTSSPASETSAASVSVTME